MDYFQEFSVETRYINPGSGISEMVGPAETTGVTSETTVSILCMGTHIVSTHTRLLVLRVFLASGAGKCWYRCLVCVRTICVPIHKVLTDTTSFTFVFLYQLRRDVILSSELLMG